jgi:hypothetical protein
MKKTLFFTALVLIVALSISMVACAPVEDTPQPDTRYALQEELVLSNDLDYRTVTLNEGKYPVLSDQGLFLVTGYDETDFNVALQVPADDEDGIRNHFDPTKPSIIIIHGLQMGVGRYGQVTMSAENREAEVRNKIYNKYVQDGEIEYLQDSRFDKIHDLTKYWYDGGNGGRNVFRCKALECVDKQNSSQRGCRKVYDVVTNQNRRDEFVIVLVCEFIYRFRIFLALGYKSF